MMNKLCHKSANKATVSFNTGEIGFLPPCQCGPAGRAKLAGEGFEKCVWGAFLVQQSSGKRQKLNDRNRWSGIRTGGAE
jgi:hypothetical protein